MRVWFYHTYHSYNSRQFVLIRISEMGL